MVHAENQGALGAKSVAKMASDIKMIQEVYMNRDESAATKRLEALATSGSTIDAGTLIEAIDATRQEIMAACLTRAEYEASLQAQESVGKDELTRTIADMNRQLEELRSGMSEDREETEASLGSLKKVVAGKLDSVFFDDELDELKKMITILSEMTSDSNNSEALIRKLKENTGKPKPDRGGMRLPDSQKQELELMLQEWPRIQSK